MYNSGILPTHTHFASAFIRLSISNRLILTDFTIIQLALYKLWCDRARLESCYVRKLNI